MQVQAVIQSSIRYALTNRAAPLPTMRKYAQEFNDAVLMQHVDLYVNEWTVDMGQIGLNALAELSSRAAVVGLAASPLQFL
ncbi:MAG: MqnA/MqnD/SBP family protein [Pirellulaceae bacterium]